MRATWQVCSNTSTAVYVVLTESHICPLPDRKGLWIHQQRQESSQEWVVERREIHWSERKKLLDVDYGKHHVNTYFHIYVSDPPEYPASPTKRTDSDPENSKQEKKQHNIASQRGFDYISIPYRFSYGVDHLSRDVAAGRGGHSLRGARELRDDRLEPDAGDVSEPLRGGEHVGAEGVDDDLNLAVLDLLHQRTKTVIQNHVNFF